MTNPPERMTRRDHLLDQDVGEHEPLRSFYTRIIDWHLGLFSQRCSGFQRTLNEVKSEKAKGLNLAWWLPTKSPVKILHLFSPLKFILRHRCY